jgi:hypothetical protein
MQPVQKGTEQRQTRTRQAQPPGQKTPDDHQVQLYQAVEVQRQRSATGQSRLPIQPVTPIQVNLEDQIKDMFQDPFQSPILLCLGQKGGGKSFRIMTILMWLIRNDIFDKYYLILPTFNYEASNSYLWLNQFQDRVFISTVYTPEISMAFLERDDAKLPPHEIPRCFLWMDDVGMNDAFRNDQKFVGLLSIARHKRLSVCLCYHSLTSGQTLSPFLRQNVTHTLLFRVTNEKLLESIYEELVSMTGHFERFRDFKQTYNQHTCSEVDPETGEITKNYNGLCINNSLGCIDWELGQWYPEESELLEEYLDKMKQCIEDELIQKPLKVQIPELTPEVIEEIKPNKTKPIQWSSQVQNPIQAMPPKQLPLFLSNPHHLRRHHHRRR